MQDIQKLQPSGIWAFFDEILAIPRPSKKEEKMIAYLIDFAQKRGLPWKKDAAGNLLITKKAAEGYENMAIVVLQSHMDMVCEKNEDLDFDFLKDPIQAYIEEGWVKARGTTLGADNGIGIAAQLAILDDQSLKHGLVECLFTVDEETGLAGANNLKPDFFTGKILINLDSEDEGELFIGCAGGMDTLISFPLQWTASAEDTEAYELKIGGLLGGHSGDDIHKGRGNANKLMARMLWNAMQSFDIGVSQIRGGNLRNAIPRQASAVITISRADREKFISFMNDFSCTVKAELHSTEKNLSVSQHSLRNNPQNILQKQISTAIISALHICPNGVIEMSRDIPGLVETSTNLAAVKTTDNNTMEIITSQRSSIQSAKSDIASRIKSLFELAGAKVMHTESYPGWTPNLHSPLLQLTRDQYKLLFTKKPVVRAIHAGLECGLFLKKYPYLDMISFGPTIKDAHSPNERMEIDSVIKFWDLLLAVLKNLPSQS